MVSTRDSGFVEPGGEGNVICKLFVVIKSSYTLGMLTLTGIMRLGSNWATIGIGVWPADVEPPPPAAACCFCSIVEPPVGCSGGGFCDVTSCLMVPMPFFMPLPAAVMAFPDLPAIDGDASLLLSVLLVTVPPPPLLCCDAAAAAAAFLALALAAYQIGE